MEKAFRLKILTPENASLVNKIAMRQPYKINLEQDNYVINAKSIMGVFAFNINAPIRMVCYSEDTQELESKLRHLFL